MTNLILALLYSNIIYSYLTVYSFFILFIITGSILILKLVLKKEKWIKPNKPFPIEFRQILTKKVHFYNQLNTQSIKRFEYKIHEFLLNHRITGIECDVSIEENILVAASAVIPIYNIPNWNYNNLYEVFLYPEQFNQHHEIKGENRNILGMVGTGYMDGKMILSKKALHHGFDNETDKKNTAIHEFVHLIDKMDGNIDGVPEVLMEKQYIIPWIDLIEKEITKINQGKSDINSYGGTSKTEFFAVASEYFFERPKLLAKKHPELYNMFETFFKQDLKVKGSLKSGLKLKPTDNCPCNNGKKFKDCCGKKHFNT